ncbi:MAG: cobalamin-dependent protein [Nitrospirae bacterium]|nr:cobalamin-dependent protein [Magnetococcales bacterium]HAT49181.1 hypothetical protein [Alphaproteobacteria bacterium]
MNIPHTSPSKGGKIVLFNPKPSEISRKKGVLPLALLAIGNLLHREGYEVLICDGMFDTVTPKMLQGAVCLGIGAMIGYQIQGGLKVAQMARASCPDLPIVWGGWHPSIQPEQTAQSPWVDVVVRGQGEITFYELVKALETGGDLQAIQGLIYKKNGHIHSTPHRSLVDPNEFPPLPYHLLDMERYIHETEFGYRTINYISSVGCPHRCGFCAEQLVHGRSWLPLTADRVVSDLAMLAATYSLDAIAINDSDFFISEKRVIAISQGLLDHGVHLKWGNVNGRPDELVRYRESTWALMKKSGLSCLLTGAETSDGEILAIINKGGTVQQVIELAQRAGQFDIALRCSFMVGLPFAQRRKSLEAEFSELMDFINRLYEENQENMFLVFLYTPFPGSPLFDTAVELGYAAPQSLEAWAENLTGLNQSMTPWMDDRVAERVYQVNFYFPFVSGVVRKIIAKKPFYQRIILSPVERILFYWMKFRLKRQFFAFPLEYHLIRKGFQIFH